MLRSVNIENIAVIEKCNIDFESGFIALTGETGAGKSIIIDSINAVTGQRTSRELIRSNCNKGSVFAVFDDISPVVASSLSEYGISIDEGSVTLLRSISSDGRSVCKINGITVNTAVMREIGSLLINIHGQHDSQSLLNPESHLGFIDSFGNLNGVLEDYRQCYRKLKDVRKQLKSLTLDEDNKYRRIDLLKYQINEITAAGIKIGELKELQTKRELIRNSEKLKLALSVCTKLLSGDDDSSGATDLAMQGLAEFSKVSTLFEGKEKLLERFDFAVSEIADISVEIRDLTENVSFDANKLEECEQRIDLLNSLNKKYGGDEAEVLKFLENATKELQNIQISDTVIEELEQASEALEDELIDKAAALTSQRKIAAENFSQKVCDVLRYLEMHNIVFSVSIKPKIYTFDGCDNVEFLISANKGQEARPLAKIASGGELSRTMLAIKSILTADSDADTLIFDEIDSGISSKAADKVGRQLKYLSKNKQVICVTHLAQIAAAANSHYLISKASTDTNTYTNVIRVEGDERINEIARIMSGTLMTENLYNSAKELIENHKDIC